MKIEIPLSNEQRRSLIASLEAGGFNIDALPEVAARMPRLTEWAEFWRGITEDNDPATIPLYREVKIAILKSLQSGYFNLNDFLPVIEVEEKRERFLELMQAASVVLKPDEVR